MFRPNALKARLRSGKRAPGVDGTIVAYACKVAKIAGVIIDGVATDIGEIRKYGVPLWCRGLSAVTTKRIGLAGEFCVPVSCGGVDVRPGDVIIADECGIVVMDPRRKPRRRRSAPSACRMRKLPDISGATKTLQEALAKQKP